MRTLLLAGVALTLAACGGGEDTTTNTMTVESNMMTTDNMMMDENAMMNGTMDANMTGNMAMDPATHNAMMADMNTNDPDTNLANGM